LIVLALERLQTLKVGDVMATSVFQLRPDQSMSKAAQDLAAHEISSAPVVDQEGRCVGILSAADFLKREHRAGAAVSSQDLFAGRTLDAAEPEPDAVARFMSSAVQAISADATMLQAARVMCAQHIHHLPVLRHDRIVGVISTMDIVAAVVNAVEELTTQQSGPA
jgi:CBS-domain-containing membrane protein